jgi:hypothetical protein
MHIDIISRSLTADDGTVLSAIDDFLMYAESNPAEAARTFVRKDFGEWLSDIRHSREGDLTGINIELYDHFKFDTNKERAVDNFLVSHGLKEKSGLSVDQDSSNMRIKPGHKELISGFFNISRETGGFIEAQVSVNESVPWLRLITNKITSSSFDKNGASCVDYVINPLLLRKPRDMADITVKTHNAEHRHRLYVCVMPIFTAYLNKNAFTLLDSGKIIVNNNTGTNIKIEIIPKHEFISFKGRNYLITDRADIHFNINLTQQRFNMLAEKDNFFARSEILIKTVFEGVLFTRVVELAVTTHKGLH